MNLKLQHRLYNLLLKNDRFRQHYSYNKKKTNINENCKITILLIIITL